MLGGFARGRGPSKTSLFALLLVTVAAVVAACGSNGNGSNFNGSHDAGGAADGVAGDGTFPGFGDGGGDGSGFNNFQSLFFAPNTATISLTPTVATGTATFTLMATRSDGSSVQVQATSLQFDRPDLATMTPGEPVSLAASGPRQV